MIAIIDYGMGNLRSVQKAFERIGAQAVITQNPKDLQEAQKVVLPGVGAMKPAMDRLSELNFVPSINESVNSGKPFLGICLGLQLLFDESNEGGAVKGLGLLPGTVERFTSLKVPHIGWNQLNIKDAPCALFDRIKNLVNVYFCHSYFVKPKNAASTATTTDYGVEFTSAVHWNNIFGVQFHPEKSQEVGLQILKNFTEVCT